MIDRNYWSLALLRQTISFLLTPGVEMCMQTQV